MGVEQQRVEAPDIVAIATDDACIPPTPPIVSRCLELRKDPVACLDEMVTVIGADPGLAAAIVRLANTRVYGFHRRVTSVDEAVVRMGSRQARELVITRKLMEAVDGQATYPVDRTVFWRWNVITATLAGRLADAIDRGAGSTAFVCGLLAHVGVVILNHAAPKHYAPVGASFGRQRLQIWLEVERHVWPDGHATVGAEVLSRWGLDEDLCEAVRWHHVHPSEVPEDAPGRAIALVLWVASELADTLGVVEDTDAALREAYGVLEQAGLDPGKLLPLLCGVEQDAVKVAKALKVPITSVAALRHFGVAEKPAVEPKRRLGIARVVNGRQLRR